jgi:hypothetical protein
MVATLRPDTGEFDGRTKELSGDQPDLRMVGNGVVGWLHLRTGRRQCRGKIRCKSRTVIHKRVPAGQATLVAEGSPSSHPPMSHDTGVLINTGDQPRGRAWHDGSREAAGGIAVDRLAT